MGLEIRDFCRDHDIIFQGFSLLTANKSFLFGDYLADAGGRVPRLKFRNPSAGSTISKIMQETNKGPAQIVFKFCHQLGILPITGTTSSENMKLNLDLGDFELSPSQIKSIEEIAFR